MTKITILKKNGKIYEYQVKGHSGYAENGHDIVCSGISACCQMALIGLNEVLDMKVDYQVNDAYFHVWISDFSNCCAQSILQSMEKTLLDIAKNYARYVKMEVREDVC